MKRAAVLCFALSVAGLCVHRVFQLEKRSAWAGPPPPPASADGDVNGDGLLNIGDPIHLLRFLFQGGPPPVPCQVSSAPVSVVIIVRHAEKGADQHLNAEGQARARHLAEVLGQATIDFLIASNEDRTQETLQPLADLKPPLTLEKIATAPEVVDRLNALPAGSLAVVCHHSFTIHPILDGLEVEGHSTIDVSTSFSQFLIVLRPQGQKPQLVHLMY